MFTYNILIYQFEPEPLILRGFPALLIHLSVENGIISFGCKNVKIIFDKLKYYLLFLYFSNRLSGL